MRSLGVRWVGGRDDQHMHGVIIQQYRYPGVLSIVFV